MKSIVTVYDKKNNLLAVFNKDDTLDDDFMIDPSVSITQNGESTFTFSIAANSKKWKDIKYFENIYEVNGRHYTALNEGSYVYNRNADGTVIVTVTLVETWYLLSKEFAQIYNVDPEINYVDDQTILILPRNSVVDTGFPDNTIYINGKRLRDSEIPYPRGSAGYALYALLYGTEWELSMCDVLVDGFDAREDYGSFNLETDMKPLLENIQMVQELWGGILVWDSKGKKLSLRDDEKFQNYHGFDIRYGKNLKSIENVVNNDIYTRVFPLGETNLNIKAVNDGKAYLENFEYTDRVYSKIIQNSNIYSQKALKFWGKKELKKLSKPSKNITVQLYDLRETDGYRHEIFDLNDIVDIVDDGITGGEPERQRIIAWTYKVFNIQDCVVELGSRTKNVVDIIKESDSTNSDFDSLINGRKEYVGDKIKSLAEFRKEANDKYATIEALTMFQKETADGFSKAEANFKLLSDADKAMAELFTSYQKETANEFGKVRSEAQAYVKILSDANQATVELATRYKKETDTAMGKLRTETQASITAVSNELSAQVTIMTKYTDNSVYNAKTSLNNTINGVKSDLQAADNRIISSMAKIETKADNNGASISQIVSAVGSNGRVTAASIVTSVNSTGSSVKISADKVEIDNLYPYRIRSIYNSENYILVGDSRSSWADTVFYRQGTEMFRIYDGGSYVGLWAKNNEFIYSSGSRTYPQGTWDFSECTVRNLDTSATFG